LEGTAAAGFDSAGVAAFGGIDGAGAFPGGADFAAATGREGGGVLTCALRFPHAKEAARRNNILQINSALGLRASERGVSRSTVLERRSREASGVRRLEGFTRELTKPLAFY
jgi:hypothetical protein